MDSKSPCAISLAGLLNKLVGNLPDSIAMLSLLLVLAVVTNFAKQTLLVDAGKNLARFYYYYRFYLSDIKIQVEKNILKWFTFIRSFQIAFTA